LRNHNDIAAFPGDRNQRLDAELKGIADQITPGLMVRWSWFPM